VKLRAMLAAGVLAASSVAFGVTGLGIVDTGATNDTIDSYKVPTGDFIDTDPLGSVKRGIDEIPGTYTDNIEPVVNLEVGASSDIMFQRRDGEQVLRGETITATKDYAFVGGVYENNGFTAIDVTDPENPEVLAEVSCGGFHNDIVVYEQYVVIGHDGGAQAHCDGRTGLPSGAGIYVYDVSDPANPEFVHAVGENGRLPSQKLTQATHNISLNPREGMVYYSTAGFHTDPVWGAFSLKGDVTQNESVEHNMGLLAARTDGTAAADGCHDQGLAFGVTDATGAERDLLFCAAIGTTLIWDITEDPTNPVHVSTIVNPSINIHHGARLAPDGHTLLVNDELGGAAAGVCTGGAPTGTQFAYDISVPEAPVPIGYGATDELQSDTDVSACTSHFYNFIAPEQNADGAQLSVTGWYRSGVVVHDFTRLADLGPIGAAPVYARAAPEGAVMWTGYAYRGYLYSASYGGETGFFVYRLDGYTPGTDGAPAEVAEPLPFDAGTSWGPWTGGTSPVEPTDTPAVDTEG